MIRRIHIRNYALIKDLILELEPGLNVILGETGSGKSMVIGALAIALGENASPDLIYPGENKCVIEVEFIASERTLTHVRRKYELEESSDTIIITKEFTRSGSTRSFINDSPALAGMIRNIASQLVDFHSQHDQHSLLERSRQLGLIDNFAKNLELREKYLALFNEQKQLITQAAEIGVLLKSAEEKEQLNAFILEEIGSADPKAGEDEELDERIKLLENSEELIRQVSELDRLISSEDHGIAGLLTKTRRMLNALAKMEKTYDSFAGEMTKVISLLDELSNFNSSFLEKTEYEPAELEALRLRYSRLGSLKRKYGSLGEILGKKELLEKEQDETSGYREELSRILEKLNDSKKEIGLVLQKLNETRETAFEKLRLKIPELLKPLGFDYVRIDLLRQPVAGHSGAPVALVNGNETVLATSGDTSYEIYVTTNKGIEPGPIRNILSGGEMSRLMLGLKSLVAGTDMTPTLIFDEIDTGISGAVARNAGFAIKKLGTGRQVICITHSAQIASLADSYYSVVKTEENERAVSHISKIKEEEFIIEIAKLLSSGEVSENSVKLARELISFS